MTIQGSVDLVDPRVIGGWVFDRDRPGNILTVDIVNEDRIIGQAVACCHRNELQFKGLDFATHGFFFAPETPISELGKIRVRVSETEAYLPIALDPIPIPPDDLIFAVVGGRNIAAQFLATGAEDKTSIQNLLERNGAQIRKGTRILDWGCGCGRIGRHWAMISDTIEYHGCDINAQLIEWCQKNIPFGTFTTSGLKPPLPYPDEYFDAIYGISVLTHLLFDTQYQWVSEIWRVLKPGGFAVLTAQGPSMVPHVSSQLSRSKTHLVDMGMFIDLEEVEGSNTTGNIVTEDVMMKIFDPFVTLDHRPCYGLMGIQDSYVFYKNTSAKLSLTPILFQSEMKGSTFEVEIEPPVPTFRRCSFLVSAKKLIYPAEVEMELQFPDSALLPIRSRQCRVPEKWVWANVASASTFIQFDNIPSWNGRVKLIARCKSERPLDGIELGIRNAFFVG